MTLHNGETFCDSSKSSDWTCTAADRYFIDNKLLPWHEDERKRLSRRLEKTSAKSNFLMSSLSSAWWCLFLVEVPRYHHHLSSSLIQISFMFFMKFTNKQFPVVVERFYDFARFLRSLAYSNEKKFVFTRPERAHAAAAQWKDISRLYFSTSFMSQRLLLSQIIFPSFTFYLFYLSWEIAVGNFPPDQRGVSDSEFSRFPSFRVRNFSALSCTPSILFGAKWTLCICGSLGIFAVSRRSLNENSQIFLASSTSPLSGLRLMK